MQNGLSTYTIFPNIPWSTFRQNLKGLQITELEVASCGEFCTIFICSILYHYLGYVHNMQRN